MSISDVSDKVAKVLMIESKIRSLSNSLDLSGRLLLMGKISYTSYKEVAQSGSSQMYTLYKEYTEAIAELD